MSAKKNHISPSEYLKYLKGELSPGERHSFERELEADPFQKEALEGLEMIDPAAVEEDMLALHATLQKRLKRRRRLTWYGIAATAASLLIVGTVFINIYDFSPKSAEESLLPDESFLTEEPVTQGAVPDQEEINLEQETPEVEKITPQQVKTAPTEIKESPQKEELASPRGEVATQEEVVLHDADEAQAMRLAPEKDEVMAMEAAPEIDELVVMEAAPQASRKKSRAEKAPETLAGQVSGIVVSSEDMEPLPGAIIIVKGTESGMMADMEGRFTLVADQQSQTTVIASFVGMESSEVQLAGGTENRVVLHPDMLMLNEVVVVGRGIQRKANPTAAVQTVDYSEEEEYTLVTGAEPEGGLEAYTMYMEEQIRFPAGDTISKRAVVVLTFSVDADGTVSNILGLRSPGEQFTEVAISLLKEGPAWKPARDENGPTNDEVRMRIVFKR